MARMTVTQFAKQLGVPRERLQAPLQKLGKTNVTARTSVTEEEQTAVREMLQLGAPGVKIGEETVRVNQTVTGQETVTDRRVAGNVIRRRRHRENPPMPIGGFGAESAPEAGEALPPPEFVGEELPPLPPEPVPPPPETEAPTAEDLVPPPPPPPAEEERRVEARVPEPAPSPRPRPALPAPGLRPGRVMPAHPEAGAEVGGPKVLGRIDLTKAEAPRSARKPEAAPMPPAPPGEDARARRGEPRRDERKKRSKLKVIQKDVSEFDRFYRPGRRPQKKRALPGKELRKTEITVPKASKRVVRVPGTISVGDLARAMGVKAGEVLKKLMDMGTMATINQILDFDTASLIASEFEHTVESTAFDAETMIEEEHAEADIEDEAARLPRPPVVTVMGHVDHGKTSLLDALRKTSVVEGEAGGITQHIGAYSVPVGDRRVTFVDTPGHEAFTAMRARGAKVTDIVVLVVAADDGVMPQTIEAINHARSAAVPIVVAVNKIDKPDADPERVKRGLSEQGLVPEDWGGDVTVVPVSAKSGEGLGDLLEMLLLQADVLELKANPAKLARGIIIEAKLERGRGPVATVLVQEGTLNAGDPFVCGKEWGRVRAMVDEHGEKVQSAGPATPVEILGLQGVPEAGDTFTAVKDEATAKQVAEHRGEKEREAQLTSSARTSLDEMISQMGGEAAKELRIIVKGDVQGSVEALQQALGRLSTDEVKLTFLHASVGGVSESDVLLATASKAMVLGFNVRPESKAAKLAEREGVEIRLYRVIYEAIEDVRKALEGLLEPEIRENVIGRAEVRQPFQISGIGTIAGSLVTEGRVSRTAFARLLRDNVVVWEGKLSSLRRFKDDVREVVAGTECGIGLERFNDVKAGDVIEFFERESVARRLEIGGAGKAGTSAQQSA